MCDQYKALMNAYLDGDITEAQIRELELHVASCDTCMVEFEELKYLKLLLSEEAFMPLPDGFDDRLHEKLIYASEELDRSTVTHKMGKTLTNGVKHFRTRTKVLGSLAAVLLVGVLVVSQSNSLFRMGSMSKSKASYEMAYDGTAVASAPQESNSDYGSSEMFTSSMATEEGATYDMASSDGAMLTASARTTLQGMDDSAYREERIIIKTANLSIDVEDYDLAVSMIKATLDGTEGYVESESTNYRTRYTDRDNLKFGSYVLRVPTDMFDSTLETIKAQGFTTYDDVTATDVTKDYRDTASQIENLKITEERLREILDQAEEISDILAIENELTRTRQSIDALTNQLKSWENLSDLSYVYLDINEVESLNPTIDPIDQSIFSEAQEGFINTINDLITLLTSIFIWIVSKSPILAVIAIVAVIGVRIWRKKK